MLTKQHIEENLSRAYIQAVAAKAGVNLSLNRLHDYGVDGSFHEVDYIHEKISETGCKFDFQLKASKNCGLENESIKYDVDAQTYNYLCERAKKPNTTPIVLIVLALHQDEDEWLTLSADELIMRKCCYWIKLSTAITNNTASKRIEIPCRQLFDDGALKEIMEKVKRGEEI